MDKSAENKALDAFDALGAAETSSAPTDFDHLIGSFAEDEPAPAAGDEDDVVGAANDVVVPRVAVDFFCESADFASAVQAAVADRRLARALATVEMGGVDGAIRRYSMRGAPSLVIVESSEGGFNMFRELERLAEVCDENTSVVVAGYSNDVALYRELIRQGVSEYIVLPTNPMQIIEAIASIYADPESAPAAKVLTVVGAKGGVGASMLAQNLAWQISETASKETVLLDLDIEFGTTGLGYNVDVKHSVVDALGDIENLDEVKLARLLYPQSETLRLLPAPASVSTGVRATEEGVVSLLQLLRATCDVIVVDAPHGWNAATRMALRQANEAVLVGTPDLACLRNLKAILAWLETERKNDTPPKIIMNQTGMQRRPEIPAAEIVDVVGAPIDLTLPFDGGLFATAVNNGQMLAEISANHKIVAELDRFGLTLIGQKIQSRPAGNGLNLLSGLFRSDRDKASATGR